MITPRTSVRASAGSSVGTVGSAFGTIACGFSHTADLANPAAASTRYLGFPVATLRKPLGASCRIDGEAPRPELRLMRADQPRIPAKPCARSSMKPFLAAGAYGICMWRPLVGKHDFKRRLVCGSVAAAYHVECDGQAHVPHSVDSDGRRPCRIPGSRRWRR